MKRRLLLVLLLVVSMLFLGNTGCEPPEPPKDDEQKIIGYFIEWGVYARNYFVKDIPADKLTHINFAFLAPFYLDGKIELYSKIPKADYKLSNGANPTQDIYVIGAAYIESLNKTVGVGVADTWACFENTSFTRRYNTSAAVNWNEKDPYKMWSSGTNPKSAGIFGEFIALKAEHPKVKVLASIGGWSYSYYFHYIAKDDASRKGFAQACQQLLSNFGDVFDGVDLDWEFPYTGGDSAISHHPEDGDLQVELLKAIREAIDPDYLSKGFTKELTIATAQNYINIPHQYKSSLKHYLNFLSVMAYDYVGGWSARTGMNAPLYASGNTNDPCYNPEDNKYMTVDEVITALLTAGIPSDQIVMGLPFYGRSFKDVENVDNGLFQEHKGVGPGTWEGGSLDFCDLVDGVNGHSFIMREGSQWFGNDGYERFWDDVTKTPYLFNGSTFITYDDDESIAEKVSYVKEKKLGGVMIWELSGDLRHDSPTQPSLLLSTVHELMKK